MPDNTPAELKSTQLVIQGDEIPFGAYQAVYHKLTRRVEKLNKAFNDGYTITFGDVENLHARLKQLLTQYQVKALRCEVTHALKDDSTRSHSSFEKFSISDCSIRGCTKALNYELDFLVVLPPEIEGAEEIAQRYKLRVTIDQDFFEENTDSALDMFRELSFGRNIRFSLEYADYSVAQSVSAVVSGWVETLPAKKSAKFLNKSVLSQIWVQSTLATCARVVPFVSGIVALDMASERPFNEQLAIAIFTLLLALTTYDFVWLLSGSLIKKLGSLKIYTFLLLTQGDRDRRESLIGNRKKSVAIISFIAIVIVLSIVLNIFSNWLYDRMFA